MKKHNPHAEERMYTGNIYMNIIRQKINVLRFLRELPRTRSSVILMISMVLTVAVSIWANGKVIQCGVARQGFMKFMLDWIRWKIGVFVK
jgi:hypothetical protein